MWWEAQAAPSTDHESLTKDLSVTEVLATLAITGAVATFALLNVGSVSTNQAFLTTPFGENEREFINFIAQHGRSYGTKEEYEFRL